MKSDTLELACKPDFSEAIKRIDAWYNQQLLDRPPVQFLNYCPLPLKNPGDTRCWEDRWFDPEPMFEAFERYIETASFKGESFPIFWPNLGPVVYSSFYGAKMIFGETTVWAEHLESWQDILNLSFSPDNIYFKHIEKITSLALEQCKGRYMVGYTDLHPGMDCVSAWRNNELLCMDLYDNPAEVKQAAALAVREWHKIFDHFDAILKQHKQLSVTWMGIPSLGKLHIPSCDFSAMISTEQFKEFILPGIIQEMKGMTHNIFHLDGPGVARHLDILLELPQINAIQWVPGAGSGEPIMQWIPLLKRIQQANKSMVITLKKEELDDFMEAMPPKGVFLCIWTADPQEQKDILQKLLKWTQKG